jgi:hypothetical protein
MKGFFVSFIFLMGQISLKHFVSYQNERIRRNF